MVIVNYGQLSGFETNVRTHKRYDISGPADAGVEVTISGQLGPEDRPLRLAVGSDGDLLRGSRTSRNASRSFFVRDLPQRITIVNDNGFTVPCKVSLACDDPRPSSKERRAISRVARQVQAAPYRPSVNYPVSMRNVRQTNTLQSIMEKNRRLQAQKAEQKKWETIRAARAEAVRQRWADFPQPRNRPPVQLDESDIESANILANL